jgi:hypothetical protein
MRNTWKLIVPTMLCASLASGCNRKADDRADSRGPREAGAPPPIVALTGCVQLAPGTGNEFALVNVHMPEPARQPSAIVTSEESPANAITEGSWVRLAAVDRDELQKHIGKRVTLTGTIRDDGRSTIGTTGIRSESTEPEPRQNRSRAAEDERPSTRQRKEAGPIGVDTMANGRAPQVAVQKIEDTGETCAAQQGR